MSIKAPFSLFEVSITNAGISGEINLAFMMIILAATMLYTMYIFYGKKHSNIARIFGYTVFITSEIGWIFISILSIQSAFNYANTHWDLVMLGALSMSIAVYMAVYVRTYKNRISNNY